MGSWNRKRLDAMGDEDLHDVHLVGTDGEEVPCCKAILATIIPFFKSMFFGGFKEENADRCSLEFHSVVVALIVKYCYCGEMDLDLLCSQDVTLEEKASLLVEAREAGKFLQIEELSSAAEAKIGNLVFHQNDNKKYHFASALLTELFKRGEDNKGPLWCTVCRFAADNSMKCFRQRAPKKNITNTYHHAHPSVLSSVLESTEDTYKVVCCLQTWCSLENKIGGNRYSDEEKRSVRIFAEDIDLRRLAASELANIKPCSLFSSERILEAFVYHCKNRGENTLETPSTELGRLYVSGAEKEDLNGYYRQCTLGEEEVLNMFQKVVKHNGENHMSVIYHKHRESKWLMSIVNYDWNVTHIVDGARGLDENCIQMSVYESSSQAMPTKGPDVPPFSGWGCIEGTGSEPLVACIYP